MKTWTIRIRKEDKHIFDFVKAGQKYIETRAATPKYQKVAVGDELVFMCARERFTKRVVRVARYHTLVELFKNEELTRIIPWIKSEEEAEKVYFSFPGYKEKIKKFGIVAWELD